MTPPGSGTPPSLTSLTNTCSLAGVSEIDFNCNKSISGSVCQISLVDDSTGIAAWVGVIDANTNAGSFTITGTANASYTLTADNGEASSQRSITVNCTAVPVTSCTIELYDVVAQPPSAAGGLGTIAYKVRGMQSATATALLYRFGQPGQVDSTTLQASDQNTPQAFAAVPGNYFIGAQDGTCFAADVEAVVGPYVAPAQPPGPPQYFPVGGVLPNPVLMPCTVSSLTTAAGDVRTGLHLELELRRDGVGGATFATVRKTVRKLQELVDVSVYLRSQLSTLPGYLPNQGLFRDRATAVGFAYRYREVDSTGPGGWVDCPGTNYAVLAARPPGQLSLARIIAELASYSGWASAFPSGEAVQFVGYPLEVGIIIPDRPANTPTFLEAVYSSAAGQVLEVRTWPVLDTAPAGYYRICLPADPLPCATKLFLAVCNENRAFAGTCDGVAPPVLTTGGNIIVGQGYLVRK